jgi:hypothetical protein
MSAIDFYIQVVKALDDIDAPYMLVGAFAGLAFGISRATFDVDILVDLQEEDYENRRIMSTDLVKVILSVCGLQKTTFARFLLKVTLERRPPCMSRIIVTSRPSLAGPTG